jgi:hypothetical protein
MKVTIDFGRTTGKGQEGTVPAAKAEWPRRVESRHCAAGLASLVADQGNASPSRVTTGGGRSPITVRV